MILICTTRMTLQNCFPARTYCRVFSVDETGVVDVLARDKIMCAEEQRVDNFVAVTLQNNIKISIPCLLKHLCTYLALTYADRKDNLYLHKQGVLSAPTSQSCGGIFFVTVKSRPTLLQRNRCYNPLVC